MFFLTFMQWNALLQMLVDKVQIFKSMGSALFKKLVHFFHRTKNHVNLFLNIKFLKIVFSMVLT